MDFDPTAVLNALLTAGILWLFATQYRQNGRIVKLEANLVETSALYMMMERLQAPLISEVHQLRDEIVSMQVQLASAGIAERRHESP